jgi:hypothetical protein
MRNTSSHMVHFRHAPVGHFNPSPSHALVVVVVIMIAMLFVMSVAILRVDDHFVVAVVLFVVMGVLGLSVNPAARRREDKISNQEHVL